MKWSQVASVTLAALAVGPLAVASSVVVAGCGGTHLPPKALTDAREEYTRAKSGVAIQLDPTDVNEADLALQRAEQAFADEPDDQNTIDLAVIARVCGFGTSADVLDNAVSPRGYRLLARVPRLPPAVVDRLVEHFGGALDVLDYPMHGKTSRIRVVGGRLFEGLPKEFSAGRYHSLFAIRDKLPADLIVTAESEDGVVMAVEHRSLPLAAVQFRPESILTLDDDVGLRLLHNVVAMLLVP